VYRVVAEVHPDNVASTRLLEKCGYTLEGTLRSWLWIDGEVHDAVQYSRIQSDLGRTWRHASVPDQLSGQ
jgi:ribosomal-protein-alanine N-acetyltransferase